jgi:Ca2+/Na+ antiporter
MGVIVALILALFIAFIFSGSRKRAIASLFLFFFVLFLAGIASMFWIVPFGPAVWGVSWLPMLFFILIVAFLFSAPSPHRRNVSIADKQAEQAEASAFGTISIFIWLFICLLVIAIITGYYKAL